MTVMPVGIDEVDKRTS